MSKRAAPSTAPTALRANHCEAADAVARKSQRASPPASLLPSPLTQHQHDEPLRPAPLADGDTTTQPPPAALEASAHLPLAEPVQPAAKEVASAAAETQQRDAVDQAATAHALDEQMAPRVHARAEDIIQRLNQWCTKFVESYTRKIEKVVGEYQEAQVRRLQEALTAAQEYDQLHAWNTATKAKLHEHVVLLQRHIPGEQTSKDAVLTPVRMDALTPHALPADAMSARADPGALTLTNADAEDPAQDDEVLGSEEGALSEASGPGPACASAADERRPDFSTPGASTDRDDAPNGGSLPDMRVAEAFTPHQLHSVLRLSDDAPARMATATPVGRDATAADRPTLGDGPAPPAVPSIVPVEAIHLARTRSHRTGRAAAV